MRAVFCDTNKTHLTATNMLVSPPLTGALLPADLLATDWLMVDDDADDAGVGLVVGRFLPLEAPPASILCVCVFFFPFFSNALNLLPKL